MPAPRVTFEPTKVPVLPLPELSVASPEASLNRHNPTTTALLTRTIEQHTQKQTSATIVLRMMIYSDACLGPAEPASYSLTNHRHTSLVESQNAYFSL